MKKQIVYLISTGFLVSIPSTSFSAPETVGVQPVELTVQETSILLTGKSVKKALLDQDVYNGKNEKVGKIEDLVVAADKEVTFVIVGAGGFLGLGKHDVALPVRLVTFDDNGRIVVEGATKSALLEMPKFKYTK